MRPIILNQRQFDDLEMRRRQTHDRRLYMRLSAVLWVAQGKQRQEVANLLGICARQLREWLRIFRKQGVEGLCTLQYRGDPGNLTAGQVAQLKEEVATGRFRSAEQIRAWLRGQFGVGYSASGIKDLLKRIGASYHQVTGFLWKGDPDEQQKFVHKVARQRRQSQQPGAARTRRYYVDACHPLWGVELIYSCWLLVGQRLLVGMGSGRKRLNILGAYCPDDQEYVDLRLTRDNINGEQFVNLLRLLRDLHPETEKFLLYVDGARYYSKPVVKEWLARHRQFRLVPIPKYSPNVNLIERLWKLLRREALSRWHQTFADMQTAVSEVLDHLPRYESQLQTLMTEKFHIIKKSEIPVEYVEAA